MEEDFRRLVVGISGASGVIYGIRILEILNEIETVETHLILTNAAKQTIGMETDFSESFWVAELVREQLLAEVHDELPHSIATRVTEWNWPHIRCEILVERDSQKGIVIGHKGQVLKKVGIEVRKQLQEGAFIELVVKVEKDWQKRPRSLDRFGY